MTLNTKYCYLLSSVFLMLFLVVPPSFPSDSVHLAIFPFNLNSEKDLTSLRDGITDMLTTRLDKGERTVFVDREVISRATQGKPGRIDKARATELCKQIDADVAIFGSITAFGEVFSFDAQMIDIHGKRLPVAYYQKGERIGALINYADEFAMQVSARLFPASTPEHDPAPATQAGKKVPSPSGESGQASLSESAGKALSPANNGSDKKRSGEMEAAQLKHFNQPINGIAIGDIDADGFNETVIITENSVLAMQYQGARLVWSKKLHQEPARSFKAVDVADIDGDGCAEIFISSLDFQETSVSSLVLEFDGKRFVKIVAESPWTYRAVKADDNLQRLYGQKDASYHPFAGNTYALIWRDNAYEPQQEIRLPSKTSVMGFAAGDVMHAGKPLHLSLSRNDKLQISDPSGKRIWLDREASGGSTLHFKIPDDDIDGPVAYTYLYYPTRVLVADVDGDDLMEVITIVNHESFGRRLKSRRVFKEFTLKFLTGTGTGLTEAYKTPISAGCARDFALADYNNDGSDELVVALINGPSSGSASSGKGGSGKGSLIVYGLPMGKQ